MYDCVEREKTFLKSDKGKLDAEKMQVQKDIEGLWAERGTYLAELERLKELR